MRWMHRTRAKYTRYSACTTRRLNAFEQTQCKAAEDGRTCLGHDGRSKRPPRRSHDAAGPRKKIKETTLRCAPPNLRQNGQRRSRVGLPTVQSNNWTSTRLTKRPEAKLAPHGHLNNDNFDGLKTVASDPEPINQSPRALEESQRWRIK